LVLVFFVVGWFFCGWVVFFFWGWWGWLLFFFFFFFWWGVPLSSAPHPLRALYDVPFRFLDPQALLCVRIECFYLHVAQIGEYKWNLPLDLSWNSFPAHPLHPVQSLYPYVLAISFSSPPDFSIVYFPPKARNATPQNQIPSCQDLPFFSLLIPVRANIPPFSIPCFRSPCQL